MTEGPTAPRSTDDTGKADQRPVQRARLRFGPFVLDRRQGILLRGGEVVPLAPRTFDTLAAIVEKRGELIGKEDLIHAVWGDAAVEESNLAQNVFVARKTLGDTPAGDSYIETFPRRGYRLTVPVVDEGLTEVTPEAGALPAAGLGAPSPAGMVRRRRNWWLAAALLPGLAIAAYLLLQLPHTAREQPGLARTTSVAVLPFRPLDGRSADAFGLGMADAVTVRLTNLARLAVRPTSRIVPYQEVPDLATAARELAVDAVVDGHFQREEERIRVTVQLVAADGVPIWGGAFDGRFADVFTLQDAIARQIANALIDALDRRDEAALAFRPTRDLGAYELYLEGRYLAEMLVDVHRAIDKLEEAVRRDPEFDRAWSSLAFAHVQSVDLVAAPRDAYPAVLHAATRALELDPNLAEARLMLAFAFWQYRRDYPAAEKEFRQALAAEPDNAFVRGYFTFFLALMGRFDECRQHGELTTHSDPGGIDGAMQSGLCLYFARDYRAAEQAFDRLLAREPSFWLGHCLRGRAIEQQGRLEEAAAEFERAHRLEPSLPEPRMDQGRVLARLGRRQEAETLLAELRAAPADQYVSPFHLAMVELWLGRPAAALDELERAIDAPSWYVTWLAQAPELDPLRADPRYPELLRRAGFMALD